MKRLTVMACSVLALVCIGVPLTALASNVGEKVGKLTDASWWDNRKFTDAERVGDFVVVFLQKYNGDFDYNYEGTETFTTGRLTNDFKDDCLSVICVWGNQDERDGRWRLVAPSKFPGSVAKNVYVTKTSGFFSKFNVKPNEMEGNTYVIVISPFDVVLWRGPGNEFNSTILSNFVNTMTNPHLADANRLERFQAVDSGVHRFLDNSELCKRLEKTLIKNKATQTEATSVLNVIETDIKKRLTDADALKADGKTFAAWRIYDAVFTEFDGASVLKEYKTARQELEKDNQVKNGKKSLKEWQALSEKAAAVRSERDPDMKKIDAMLAELDKFKKKYPDSPFAEEIDKAIYGLNVKNGTIEGIVSDNKYIEPLNGILADASGNPYDAKKLTSMKYMLVYFSAHWCGPCRAFTPELVKFYNANKGGGEWEIVFMSSDRDAAAMASYMVEMKMPWPAVQFDKIDACPLEGLAKGFIPHLVMLDSKGAVVSEDRDAIFELLLKKLAE